MFIELDVQQVPAPQTLHGASVSGHAQAAIDHRKGQRNPIYYTLEDSIISLLFVVIFLTLDDPLKEQMKNWTF